MTIFYKILNSIIFIIKQEINQSIYNIRIKIMGMVEVRPKDLILGKERKNKFLTMKF